MVEALVPAPAKAERKTPPSGFHHTRGVYGNGEFKDNGVSPEHIDDHIEYNLVMRPGRAFFVDGACLNRGYLTDEACRKVEEQLVGVKATRCTAPYR